MPKRSNAAVLRFTFGPGSLKTFTSFDTGSTRTIAFCPPSVTHGAPSGPTITPCGADPAPSFTMRVAPVLAGHVPGCALRHVRCGIGFEGAFAPRAAEGVRLSGVFGRELMTALLLYVDDHVAYRIEDRALRTRLAGGIALRVQDRDRL